VAGPPLTIAYERDDWNGRGQVYLYDLLTDGTLAASESYLPFGVWGDFSHPALSADARNLAFVENASDGVTPLWLWILDLSSGERERLSWPGLDAREFRLEFQPDGGGLRLRDAGSTLIDPGVGSGS